MLRRVATATSVDFILILRRLIRHCRISRAARSVRQHTCVGGPEAILLRARCQGFNWKSVVIDARSRIRCIVSWAKYLTAADPEAIRAYVGGNKRGRFNTTAIAAELDALGAFSGA